MAAGLALGVGAVALVRAGGGHAYAPGTPSVSAFPFDTRTPTAAGTPAPPPAPPPLADEPADPAAAVAAFLQPLAAGRPELAYPLLDQASRTRYSTPALWSRAQVDRIQPMTFTIGASRASPTVAGAVTVEVSATHRPSLDAIRGLVPARSESAWLVRREGDAWRVSADPLSVGPLLPSTAAATDAVQAWVNRLAACDTPGAVQLQAGLHLYGPATLAQAPCRMKGAWTAGAPVDLDAMSVPRALLAAFGPDVGAWARLVPVRGPAPFLAAVAPIDDSWQVMGVAIDGG